MYYTACLLLTKLLGMKFTLSKFIALPAIMNTIGAKRSAVEHLHDLVHGFHIQT